MYLRELFLNLDEGKEDFLANRDGEKLLAAVDYKNDPKLQKRFQTLAPITNARKFEYGEYSPEYQMALIKQNPHFFNKIINPTDQAVSYIISRAPRIFQQTVKNPSERAIMQFIKAYPAADVDPEWKLTPRIQKILQLKNEYRKKNRVPWHKVDMNAIAKAAMQSEPKIDSPINTSESEPKSGYKREIS